jgi:methyl-accepting chemotaxis protein
MFPRLSLRARLLGGYCAVALAGAISGGAAVLGVSSVNDQASALFDRHLRGLSFIKEANVELIQVARYRALFASAGDAGARSKYRDAFEQHLASVTADLDKAAPLLVTAQDQQLLKQVESDLAAYTPHGRAFIAAVDKIEPLPVAPGVSELNKVAIDTFKVVTDGLDRL